MKFVRFAYADKEHYGVLIENEKILSLSAISSKEWFIPNSLEELIALDSQTIDKIECVFMKVRRNYGKSVIYNLNEVVLLAPIDCPPKIICLGLNYYDHAAEQEAEIPSEPVIFMKPRTAITGPNQPIVKPSFVKRLDYEVELAVVLCKKGKNIPVEEAKGYIFGYTALNDVSARDIQFKDRQWTRGKSFDTFAPIGPCITAANQVKDPSNLRLRTWVNDELRQNSSTKNMVFHAYEVVHHLSRVMTLEPCDIIATGTPAGVGVFMKPPKFLQPSDKVRVEIEGIGSLQNEVIEENDEQRVP